MRKELTVTYLTAILCGGIFLISSTVTAQNSSSSIDVTNSTQMNKTFVLSNFTNLSGTSAKLEVPLIESKLPVNDTSSQTSGSTVSIVPGSSAPSNEKYYAPETIAISKGTTVTWTNDDVTLHTVTSGTAGEGNIGTEFDSSYMAAGKMFEHAFDTVGMFDYFCTLHPFMTGKVKVQ